MHAPSRMQLAYIGMGDKAEKKSEFYAEISKDKDENAKSFATTESNFRDKLGIN